MPAVPLDQLFGPLGLTVGAILLIWYGGRVLLSIVREYIADVKTARDRWAGIAETASDGMSELTNAVTALTASVEALQKQHESLAGEIVRQISDRPPEKGVRR